MLLNSDYHSSPTRNTSLLYFAALEVVGSPFGDGRAMRAAVPAGDWNENRVVNHFHTHERSPTVTVMRRIGRTTFWVWGIGMTIVAAASVGYACWTADEGPRCVEVSEGVLDCHHEDFP